jgi:SAM-dependent methyltransferase
MNYYKIARTVLPSPIRKALKKRYLAQPESLRAALKNVINEFQIARMVKQSTKQFRRLNGARNLKVHLGCGPIVKPGWINIDLSEGPESNSNSDTMFIQHDLRLGLPFADNSASFIYSSHFFEHLEYKYSLSLLADCHRVLQPEGVFRISLPDFKSSFRAYLRSDATHFDLLDLRELLPEVEPGTETLIDHLNFGVYQHGDHKCIYDEEKIMTVLRRLGYRSVNQSSFRPEIDPPDPVRLRHSFYVEAIK